MTDQNHLPSPSERDPHDAPRGDATAPDMATCDICGSTEVTWLRCKLICAHCHTILMTCGDL